VQDGQCFACSESLYHCNECSQKYQCEDCEYMIAKPSPDGSCSSCKNENNWFLNETLGRCQCDLFMNAKD